jgi:shikimate 5-dehydrogenase
VVGANVTIPLKETVISICDAVSPAAAAIGSVNTVWRDRATGALVGDNTDWRAIFELCRPHGGGDNGDVVILGAGGTSRAACYAAIRWGAKRVVVVNRTLERGRLLAERFSRQDGPDVLAVSSCDEIVTTVPSVIISTVPGSTALTVPDAWVGHPAVRCVLDASYMPRTTALLAQFAHCEGVARIEGWRMLLEQGIWGFAAWTGGRDCRAAMEEALLAHMPQ